jgi:hypothetical protein
MSPNEIREAAFKHLKLVRVDSATHMAALFCVARRDLIAALHEPSDFRWVAGKGCWDYTLCPFACCRGDEPEAVKASSAARKSQAAYNDVHRTDEKAPKVSSSQRLLTYLRQYPGTAADIARGLGWGLSRVHFQLRRHVDSLRGIAMPGHRERRWSLR